MAQRTDKLYRLVTLPAFYRGLHTVLGADDARKRYVQEVLKAKTNERVLDVGCGPGTILDYLPGVEYTGIDLNKRHISHAVERFDGRGRFLVGDVTKELVGESAAFDLIIVTSLLHHLDDQQSERLLAHLLQLVKPGGRIVTIDNVWLPRQNPIAWILNRLDSGLNVRDVEGYRRLTRGLPVTIESKVYRNLFRIPFDHFCMVMYPRS